MTDIPTAHFEPLPTSKYPIPPGLIAHCGYITVPESRSAASGNFPSQRTLRIYVSVIKSLNPNPAPDPVVFLYGGPGGNSAGILKALASPFAQKAFLSQRDLVVFDQRGTGFSEPALFAPELEDLIGDAFLQDISSDERCQRFVQGVLAARQRFVEQGANLAAINTPEIVADIEDLRQALGYEQVNLFGISYGTRPALVAIREIPQSLRSVVLDSTVPVQVSQYVEAPANGQYAFDLLFRRVTQIPQAKAAYPRLEEFFYEVVERLNRQPARIPAKHPVTGEALSLRLSGDVFIGLLCNGFYSAEAITRMPRRILQAYQGEYGELAQLMVEMLEAEPGDLPGWSIGMYYSVNCCDDKVTAETAQQIDEQVIQYPAMRTLPLTEFHLGGYITQVGARWGARPAGPLEHSPVYGDVPTLILAGEFDQNTPSYWGRLAGKTLSNSHYVEFPGMGHGVISQGECAASLIEAFYDQPAVPPDECCVKALGEVQFVLP